jgi:SAM-dependent methyltransferase
LDYASAVASAPSGWRRFSMSDMDRLPASVRRHALATIPDEEWRLAAAGDKPAGERALRASFWTLVYHLEPERWDALAQAEPVAPALVADLPRVHRALDVGAGSGRLTRHLAATCEEVAAVEPSLGLLGLLRMRMPGVRAIAGWAEALPVRDGWSHLTTACGSFGPDPAVLDEFERVTCGGGVIALISPEQPEWFEAHGWRRLEVEPARIPDHPAAIDEFFGPPDPPRVVVTKMKGT